MRSAQPCRCGRCGAVYPIVDFHALTRVQTLAERDLAANVLRWPAGIVVDVRACARCDGPIARLAARAS